MLLEVMKDIFTDVKDIFIHERKEFIKNDFVADDEVVEDKAIESKKIIDFNDGESITVNINEKIKDILSYIVLIFVFSLICISCPYFATKLYILACLFIVFLFITFSTKQLVFYLDEKEIL